MYIVWQDVMTLNVYAQFHLMSAITRLLSSLFKNSRAIEIFMSFFKPSSTTRKCAFRLFPSFLVVFNIWFIFHFENVAWNFPCENVRWNTHTQNQQHAKIFLCSCFRAWVRLQNSHMRVNKKFMQNGFYALPSLSGMHEFVGCAHWQGSCFIAKFH